MTDATFPVMSTLPLDVNVSVPLFVMDKIFG